MYLKKPSRMSDYHVIPDTEDILYNLCNKMERADTMFVRTNWSRIRHNLTFYNTNVSDSLLRTVIDDKQLINKEIVDISWRKLKK